MTTPAPSARGAAAVTVRFYKPGDEEGILRVLQASFPRWPRVETDVAPIDHLRWKIESTPEPATTHLVAEAEGDIIACRLSLLRDVRCANETRLARTDTDDAVVQAWRGQGVNSQIIRRGVDASSADIIMTTSDEPIILRGDRALGHLPLRNRLSAMLCELSPAREPPAPPGVLITEVPCLDERIEGFWRKATEPFALIAAPSAEWLNWRYCDPRGGNGFVLLANEGGNVTGFAAVRISGGVGHIAYLLALRDRADVVRALIAAAVARTPAHGATRASCVLPRHHLYRPVLLEAGFTGHGGHVPLTARPRIGDPELPFLHKTASIHWMLGDTDLI